MPSILQFKRYNTSTIQSTTGAPGELIIDMGLNTLTIHDGVTVGGSVLATIGDVGLKQNTLVSGTNIRSVAGYSLVGSGDVPLVATDLTDINTNGVSTNDFLRFSGSAWVPHTLSILDISEINGTGAVNNDILTYDIVTSTWVATTPVTTQSSVSSLPLSTLSDVSITAATTNQTLTWSGSLWTPTTISLSSLSDTDATVASPVANHVLLNNGTSWVSAPLGTSQLYDVSGVPAVIGDIMSHDGTSWVPMSVAAATTNYKVPLSNIQGIVQTAPTLNQPLLYDAPSSSWVNRTMNSGMLSDFSGTAGTNNQILQHIGGIWTPHTILVDDITGFSTTGALIGDTLAFDGTNWAPAAASTVLPLGAASDVTITTVTNHDVLTYNGVYWTNISNTLVNTADVSFPTTPQLGEVLKYDSTNSVWLNGNLSIDNLTDVNIKQTPTTGDVLVYDSVNLWWTDTPNTLGIHTDVNLTTPPVNGDCLVYDSTSSTWLPKVVELATVWTVVTPSVATPSYTITGNKVGIIYDDINAVVGANIVFPANSVDGDEIIIVAKNKPGTSILLNQASTAYTINGLTTAYTTVAGTNSTKFIYNASITDWVVL